MFTFIYSVLITCIHVVIHYCCILDIAVKKIVKLETISDSFLTSDSDDTDIPVPTQCKTSDKCAFSKLSRTLDELINKARKKKTISEEVLNNVSPCHETVNPRIVIDSENKFKDINPTSDGDSNVVSPVQKLFEVSNRDISLQTSLKSLSSPDLLKSVELSEISNHDVSLQTSLKSVPSPDEVCNLDVYLQTSLKSVPSSSLPKPVQPSESFSEASLCAASRSLQSIENDELYCTALSSPESVSGPSFRIQKQKSVRY